MQLVAPGLEHYVVPLSLVILVDCFRSEPGHRRVGAWFGPVTGVWFVAMADRRHPHIADNPSILGGDQPHIWHLFLARHGTAGLFALGAVFLAVTGRRRSTPIWGISDDARSRSPGSGSFCRCLALNYFGQGALLLADPGKIENPFFLLYPDWALLPMVIAATIATIIASQAVITGAFSLTQQAIQLGLLPRMEVRWTSETEKGQIYVPRVNFFCSSWSCF